MNSDSAASTGTTYELFWRESLLTVLANFFQANFQVVAEGRDGEGQLRREIIRKMMLERGNRTPVRSPGKKCRPAWAGLRLRIDHRPWSGGRINRKESNEGERWRLGCAPLPILITWQASASRPLTYCIEKSTKPTPHLLKRTGGLERHLRPGQGRCPW